MARQFLRGDDYGNWGDAFAAGVKQSRDELFRQAQQDLEAQQWAEGKYKKAKKSENGYFGGYESDIESRQRDIPAIKKKIPWAFSEEPTQPIKPFGGIPAKAPLFSAYPDETTSFDLNEKFVKAGGTLPQTAWPGPQREPQQEKPLLANPKEEKKQLPYDPVAFDKDGNPIEFKPGTKRPIANRPDKQIDGQLKAKPVYQAEELPGINFNYELPPEGAAAEPAAPPPAPPPEPPALEQPARMPADFDPSDSYLARLAEYSTTGQAKETQPQIAVGNLPEKWQRLVLGKQPEDPITPQEQSITVPADIIKAVVEQSYKPQAATKTPVEFDSALADAIGQIEAGDPLNTVVRKLTVARGGKLPKADMDQLQQAKARFDANKRAEKIAGVRQENIEVSRAEKAVEKQDKAVERYKKALDDAGIVAAIPFLQQIEMETGIITGTKPEKGKLPGVGTNMARNLIPFIGDSVAMAMAKTYKGGGPSQALQGLVNVDIKNLAGANVTKYEQGRILAKYGMSAFGTEKDIANGIRLMYEGIAEAYQNVNAAFPPEIVEAFQSRGGTKGPGAAMAGLREAGLAAEKKSGKPSEKSQAPANPEYEAELQKAQSMMVEYRDRIQKEMQSKGLGAAWASRKINQAKQEADNYLKQKYKKGFVDVQNP